MSLVFKQLNLTNFRNLAEKTITFNDGLTILQGNNAVGKTNTIEALQLLTIGRSFRKPKLEQYINFDADFMTLKGRIEGDSRVIDVQFQLNGSKRTWKKNDKKVSKSSLKSLYPSILFCPDDLTFVKGSARYRRDDLDLFASLISPGYEKVIKSYTKSVEQRNNLLKEVYVDEDLLDAWDESLALGAATVYQSRKKLFLKLSEVVTSIYSNIAHEDIELLYNPSIKLTGIEDKDKLVEAFVIAFKQNRAQDFKLKHTSIGPHRDDFSFLLKNNDARDFASQGQQRSIVLSWKMAQVTLCEQFLGQKPLLLLDDVMSELDSSRRESIVNFIQNDIQTVITTTNLSYFTDEFLQKARVVHYE